MIERFVDLRPLTDHVSTQLAGAVIAAAVAGASSVTWFAGELWTERKVAEGIAAHEQRVQPRFDELDRHAEVVMGRQAEFRRDIDVIRAELQAVREGQERMLRMQERLLDRELRGATP